LKPCQLIGHGDRRDDWSVAAAYSPVIPDEVGVGHVSELLAVLIGELEGRRDLVGDEVVHEARPGRPRIAQPHDLNGGRSEGEYLVPRALGVAVHVDEDVDAVGVYAVGGLAVAGHLRQVDEVLGLAGDLPTKRGPVVRAQGVAEYLDALALVESGDRLHQVGGRMVAEVRTHVADLQA
jgi:hypothetical protein